MSASPPVDDLVQPFQVESSGIRGRLVRLGAVVDTILTRHDYPEEVSAILGEALALATALAASLKLEGIFTLQTKGDGPVSMLVADWRSPGLLRGYASVDRAALAARGAGPAGAVPRLLGAGYLAFTVDQGAETERYQGIVELTGATLADCAHDYFRRSEQLGTGIRLAVAKLEDPLGRLVWRAGGLMIQRLPDEESRDGTDDAAEDAWRRALILMSSVRDAELTDPGLPPNDLLWRLFHQEGVRVWAPQPVGFGCTCSRDKVSNVLRSFSAEQLAGMVIEGRIIATCQFCNNEYAFLAGDLIPGDGA